MLLTFLLFSKWQTTLACLLNFLSCLVSHGNSRIYLVQPALELTKILIVKNSTKSKKSRILS